MSESVRNGTPTHNTTIETVQQSMLDGLGQLASYFGFSKVMGQLYGALMLSVEPRSLDDLVELLDISKASVSMNLRTLEHLGMVRQVWVKGRGDRRKFYEAENDFWQIISNVLAGREMRDVDRALNVMDSNAERLSRALTSMSPEDQELAKLYLERIDQMQSLFRFAQLVITSILGKANEMDVSRISRIDLE